MQLLCLCASIASCASQVDVPAAAACPPAQKRSQSQVSDSSEAPCTPKPCRLLVGLQLSRCVLWHCSVCTVAGSWCHPLRFCLQGQLSRHVSSTQMNKESSRSHLIMSVVIESTNLQTQHVTRGKLSFVDLAGSERWAMLHLH